MLKSAQFKSFTCFADADLRFAKNLNIFIGDNSTGKSNALKAIYSMLKAQAKQSQSNSKAKTNIESDAADYLERNFRINSIRPLVRESEEQQRSEIALSFNKSAYDFSLGFTAEDQHKLHLLKKPRAWEQKKSLFFPSGDLLALFSNSKPNCSGNIADKHDEDNLEFRKLFNAPHKKLPTSSSDRAHVTRTLASLLNHLLHGDLVCEDGHYYIDSIATDAVDELPDTIEMPMLSEGLLKFAVLMQLVLNGTLAKTNYFFWDNPDRDLNPSHIRVLAMMLLDMTLAGMQVFIATHSLFLVREINLLLKQSSFYEDTRVKYVGFFHTYTNSATLAEKGVKKYQELDPSLPPIDIYTGVKIENSDRYEEICIFRSKEEEVSLALSKYYKREYLGYDGVDDDSDENIIYDDDYDGDEFDDDYNDAPDDEHDIDNDDEQ